MTSEIRSRFPDWDTRLQEAVNRFSKKPASGWVNCVLTVADFVKAMTGIDFAEDFRGVVQTERTAFRYLQTHYHDLPDFASRNLRKYGMRETGPNQAKRGDVVLRENPGDGFGWVFGLYLGQGRCFFLKCENPGYTVTAILNSDRCWHF